MSREGHGFPSFRERDLPVTITVRRQSHAACSVLVTRSPVLAKQEEVPAFGPGHVALQPAAG